MAEFRPVTTCEDLATLTDAEVTAGYIAGLSAEPLAPQGVTRSFWHGHRNGLMDGGHRPPDEAQQALAHAVYVEHQTRHAAHPWASLTINHPAQ
jgi:hypothetical protein